MIIWFLASVEWNYQFSVFYFSRLVTFLNEEIELSGNQVVFAMKLVTALIDLCPKLHQCIDHSQVGGYYQVEFLKILIHWCLISYCCLSTLADISKMLHFFLNSIKFLTKIWMKNSNNFLFTDIRRVRANPGTRLQNSWERRLLNFSIFGRKKF